MSKVSLAESADLAFDLGKKFCRVNPESHEDCSWYHGAWPYFRALGLVADPSVHQTFYDNAIASSLDSQATIRVLMSGSADFSILDTFLKCFPGSDADISITVVDICETPLKLCQWYAQQHNLKLETTCSNILDFHGKDVFDLIVTHAFMGNFDRNARQDLVAKWHTLLKPGGKLITVQRIREGFEAEKAQFNDTQAAAFSKAIFNKAQELQLPLLQTPDQLAAMAQTYAHKFFSYPICSQQELIGLFENAGFEFEQLDFVVYSAAGDSSLSGPAIPDNAMYAHLSAIKK